MRALGNISRALGYPIPGVANIHVPLDALVRPTLIHIQGLPRTPVIRAVAAHTPLTIACLGGTRAHARQTQPPDTSAVAANPTIIRFINRELFSPLSEMSRN